MLCKRKPTLPSVSGKREFMVEIFISLDSEPGETNHAYNDLLTIMHRNKGSVCSQVTA